MNALYLFLHCWLNIDFKVMMNGVPDFRGFFIKKKSALGNQRFQLCKLFLSLPVQLPNPYKKIFSYAALKQTLQMPRHSPDHSTVPV